MARRSTGSGISLGLMLVLVIAAFRFISVMERAERQKADEAGATWEVAGIVTSMAQDMSATSTPSGEARAITTAVSIGEQYGLVSMTPTSEEGWVRYESQWVVFEHPPGWEVEEEREGNVFLFDQYKKQLLLSYTDIGDDPEEVFSLQEASPGAWDAFVADKEKLLREFVEKSGGTVVSLERLDGCRVAGKKALCFQLVNRVPVQGGRKEQAWSAAFSCGGLLCSVWYARIGEKPLEAEELELVDRILSSLRIK